MQSKSQSDPLTFNQRNTKKTREKEATSKFARRELQRLATPIFIREPRATSVRHICGLQADMSFDLESLRPIKIRRGPLTRAQVSLFETRRPSNIIG